MMGSHLLVLEILQGTIPLQKWSEATTVEARCQKPGVRSNHGRNTVGGQSEATTVVYYYYYYYYYYYHYISNAIAQCPQYEGSQEQPQ